MRHTTIEKMFTENTKALAKKIQDKSERPLCRVCGKRPAKGTELKPGRSGRCWKCALGYLQT